MSRITVVGSFSMDLTVTMSQFPKEGQTIIGRKMLKNPGGKGATQCIAAARLGGDVEMTGMVGNDENGRIIKDLFASEGVNIEHVLTTDKEPTTIALIEIDDTAQPYSISWTLNGNEIGELDDSGAFIPITTSSISLIIGEIEGVLPQNNVLQAYIDITDVGKFNASFIFDVELN